MLSDINRQILQSLRDAVFVLDRQRKVVFANSTAGELFGDGHAGKDFVRVTRHPACLSAIDRILAGEARIEQTVSFDDPARHDYRLVVADIGSGPQGGILLVFSDITELREASKMRSEFIANVSHELRSPLTALSGFVETLRHSARDDPEARERFLGLMEREARRMIALISDLLSLSRLEARERLRPEGHANIAAVLSRIQSSLADRAQADGKTLAFDTAGAPPSIPGSEEELTQVFQNLIENAIKYGARDTEVRVEARMRERSPGISGPVLAVSVSDRGEGIGREHIPRLTERFYRVDTHRSRDKGGTGLGLAIVKHIVNRHRGRLLIESELGKGSTFTVLLPSVPQPR